MFVPVARQPDENEQLLAPLGAGDRIPWKLNADGEPQWLTVTEVVGEGSYVVRHPDGRLETLTDSE